MKKNILRAVFIIFAVILLLYLAAPAPSSIQDFPALPNSIKSKLEGDTIQVPNVAGYFSNNFRDFAAKYYKNIYDQKTGLPFPSIRLNHPPEFAYTAIKDQTQSTYLEEYVYPLRGSLFINGLEPFYEDGTKRYLGAIPFELPEGNFQTKVTLKYYPSSLVSRLVLWIGILTSILALLKVGKTVLK